MAAAPKSVLITGCSLGGVGDSLAQCFQKRKCHVFATARSLSKIEHLKALGITVLALDVQDPASIANAVEFVSNATGGKLDVLVNNSGVGYTMPMLDADIELAKNTFDINVWGLLRTTQAFAPLLIAASGTVVNVGSTAGAVSVAFRGIYCASKAAVNMITDSLRMELKPFGVKVICLMAGAIQSNFSANVPTAVLPKDSVYQFAKDLVEAKMQPGSMMVTQMPVDDFAEVTVRNALKANPQKRQWKGNGATLVWFIRAVLWHSLPEFLFSKMFGLDKVQALWEAKKKKD